ncbi:4-(cytidine 5'-diphospho)-2-C-methyl-D-erythritol kinase, partial [Bacteroides thetaiotaomicron]
PQHPVIGEIKAELYKQGAVYASMSGSGSSVYGLFEPEGTLPETDWGTNVFCFKGRL